jgi:hypothetical protein
LNRWGLEGLKSNRGFDSEQKYFMQYHRDKIYKAA